MTRPEPAPPELERLFASERTLEVATDDVRGRLRARVAASVAVGAGLPSGAESTSATSGVAGSSSAGGSSVGGSSVGGSSVGGASVGGASVVAGAGGAAKLWIVAATVTAGIGAGLYLTVDSGTERRSSVPQHAAQADPPTIVEETQLLERARLALSQGSPVDARASLERHARRFSDGALVQEREALWIRLLGAEGDPQAAQRRFERFRQRFPESPLLPSLEIE